MKRLLYSGIVILVAFSFLSGVFAQSSSQVQISESDNCSSGAPCVALATVTIVPSSQQHRPDHYEVTLLTRYCLDTACKKMGNWIPVDLQVREVPSTGQVTVVFNVRISHPGHYLLTTNVRAFPSMQFVGTASIPLDPPAGGTKG
ncbi:MAG TPA: hypothetical protein VLV31_00505 [Candidatus Acidoferrales bacterium]|nr:hypothetical protein [Candidatus Acidoferrales bacterium]